MFLQKLSKVFSVKILVVVFAVMVLTAGIASANSIINNYFFGSDSEPVQSVQTPIMEEELVGSVTAIGGICDGSEPTTQLCNVNTYDITSQSGISSATLSVSGISTLTGEVTMKSASQALTVQNSTSTIAQSGTTFFIDLASTTIGATIQLPALTEGVILNYTMATSSATSTNIIIDSTEGDNISGSLVVDGTAVPCIEEDQLNFVFSAEAAGDFVQLKSDGTYWFVTGIGEAAGSITCTDPS